MHASGSRANASDEGSSHQASRNAAHARSDALVPCSPSGYTLPPPYSELGLTWSMMSSDIPRIYVDVLRRLSSIRVKQCVLFEHHKIVMQHVFINCLSAPIELLLEIHGTCRMRSCLTALAQERREHAVSRRVHASPSGKMD